MQKFMIMMNKGEEIMKVYVVEGYEYGRLIQFGMTDRKDLAEAIAKEYEDNTEEKSFVAEYELNNDWIEFNDEHNIEEEDDDDFIDVEISDEELDEIVKDFLKEN